jgi:hypothetical protein
MQPITPSSRVCDFLHVAFVVMIANFHRNHQFY